MSSWSRPCDCQHVRQHARQCPRSQLHRLAAPAWSLPGSPQECSPVWWDLDCLKWERISQDNRRWGSPGRSYERRWQVAMVVLLPLLAERLSCSGDRMTLRMYGCLEGRSMLSWPMTLCSMSGRAGPLEPPHSLWCFFFRWQRLLLRKGLVSIWLGRKAYWKQNIGHKVSMSLDSEWSPI